ncbi:MULTISPECIES: inositol monophosphatase family protein [Chromohalobacter]|uniref:inositol monophosphatase family protein n=1 Tax=Chromohalobacter TaxID=42054 RepID=UPI000558CBC4|nr:MULTISPECIES: inositol monophosphatase family protein [Chromohalobacter]MDF9435175.1 inositol monophosphatase [Chromohalobacter israelensis]PWW32933.1 myo-inositol-1(or 4)-monophosphatase [Chromohalobacter salexigens]
MEPSQRLAEAERIARLAGERIVAARQSQAFQHRYKSGDELVTDADVDVDRLIATELDAHFRDDARLTEELSPERDVLEDSESLWIVDPIDGTVNFAYGHPHVAVSIAWASEGKLQLGVVHAPFLGETFTALRGEGAWLNGEPIEASDARELDRSLVATGFPYRRDARAPLLRRLTGVLARCRDIRRNGSAALDLCHVACGRLDAYYESVSPWDFAAGLLIAREAGAKTGHLYPCPDRIPADLYGENILVSAPGIHGALRDILLKADEGRLDEIEASG